MPEETRRGPRATSTADGEAMATTQPGGTATPTQDTIVPASHRAADVVVELPPPGYDIGALIGKGGMGEVVAAHDLRIGRDVAIKRMRSAHPDAGQVARFLREARIQARLDHPAIVPVYELGIDGAGKPYFTMKRLAGVTLAQRLTERAPLPLLLRAFIDVCLAVELAHSRAVIHRDLKPANIMLGDYGEVYVLDWGVARVLDDPSVPRQEDIDTLDGSTSAGAMLGTPGYMAPEQVNGHAVGPAADVYALGAILFEILTAQPLHPRGEGALGSTLTMPQQAPAKRAADRQIAPELDAACHGALAEAPEARPTARVLADRVQRYLDGDRDLERRRALAADQLLAARAAFESSSPDARANAVRHASRALALDPDSEEAAGVVNTLVFDPPPVHPPALERTLAEQELVFNRTRLRRVQLAYLGLLGSWVVVPFLEVVNWTPLFVLTALTLLAMANTYRISRTGRHNVATSLMVNLLLIVAYSRLVGPFMLTPTLIAAAVLTLSSVRSLSDRPQILIGWVAATVMAPFVLEWLGVIPRLWWIADGKIETVSAVFRVQGSAGEIVLVVVNVMFQCMVCWTALANSRARWDSERGQLIQAWHLKQMLPHGAQPWEPKRRSPA